jgi:hypothetical protein
MKLHNTEITSFLSFPDNNYKFISKASLPCFFCDSLLNFGMKIVNIILEIFIL